MARRNDGRIESRWACAGSSRTGRVDALRDHFNRSAGFGFFIKDETMKEVKFKPVSLFDRIKLAKNDEELLELEQEGADYEFTADKTHRKWAKAISARQKELLKPRKKK